MKPIKSLFITGLTVCCVVLMSSSESTAAISLSYADLVQRLTDLERLAVLPVPGEKCAQESSTDRRSCYDAKNDSYIDWDANIDNGQSITRMEGGKTVLAEMKGPGCIWRIWSGNPMNGKIQMVLDGAEQPTLDLPFRSYFDGSASNWPPLANKSTPWPPTGNISVYDPALGVIGWATGSALYHCTSRGWNSYVPITFQKSCKILADPWKPPYNHDGWGMFFQFTYTVFPEGNVVHTFTADLPTEDRKALDAANEALAQSRCGSDPAGKRPGQKTVEKTVQVKAGKTVTVLKLNGARAITGLKVKISLPASPGDREILRKLVLRITWDGDKEPSVWSPLGDFFGTSPGANKYRSLPLGMTDGGFYSYWYMPFAECARVELVNDDDTLHEVTFSITHAPLTRPIEQLGRFHAKWHGDTTMDPKRPIDWPMLKTKGRGRYCGVVLNIWNPKGGWWGEGDEKFFVDGEKFPSTFGTGAEDYFGYAWADPNLFSNAYHNQTVYAGKDGFTSINRWQITDNIPFQKSFEGYIEKYFTNDYPTHYDCVVYWYLAPGGEDPYTSTPLAERIVHFNKTIEE